LEVTSPEALAFKGKGTLYAFPTGIFLRFGPAADGKWHRRKWTATDFRDNGAAREVAGSGRRQRENHPLDQFRRDHPLPEKHG
jgi:hypothetical protein